MKFMTAWQTLLVLLCVLMQPFTGQTQTYQLFSKEVYINGVDTLRYRLLAPAINSEKEKVPVLVFLHGMGERGRENSRQLLHVMPEFARTAVRQKYPCYVIAPQCSPDNYWTSGERMNDGDIAWVSRPDRPQEMVMEVLDQILEHPSADADRVYLIGLSMGGAGTWDMLVHFPDRFAAAIPICGWTSLDNAPKIAHIPVWIFHGADDLTIPVAESHDMYKALKRAGGHPIYTELEGVRHNSWDYVFSNGTYVLDWLFNQRK